MGKFSSELPEKNVAYHIPSHFIQPFFFLLATKFCKFPDYFIMKYSRWVDLLPVGAAIVISCDEYVPLWRSYRNSVYVVILQTLNQYLKAAHGGWKNSQKSVNKYVKRQFVFRVDNTICWLELWRHNVVGFSFYIKEYIVGLCELFGFK